MPYVFYIVIDAVTGEGKGQGFCPEELFGQVATEPGTTTCRVTEGFYHRMNGSPHLFYRDAHSGFLLAKQKVSVSVNKSTLVADGKDVLTVTVDSPEPVGLWVNGKVDGVHQEVQVVTSRPQAYEVRVEDPRYWSEPVFFIAKQEVSGG